MTVKVLKDKLKSTHSEKILQELYGPGNTQSQAARYLDAAQGFHEAFGDKEFELFTSAGRTEILGNHTDHNHGLVAAGSVHLDCIAAAAPNHKEEIRIISQTYHQDFRISLRDLEPQHRKTGTAVLIRGVIAGLLRQGFKAGGLDVYTTTCIPGGSGLSSSASFEMLLCTMIDYFFNGYKRDIIAYAKAGQYAENKYWNKKSGLMDQIACAAGGIAAIDFKNAAHPDIRKVDFLPDQLGLSLVIVNTGKGHSDLSAEYSAVPDEMHSVASYFGKEYLSEISEQDVLSNIQDLRKSCTDRALLRSLHFFEENQRVKLLCEAMKLKDRDAFLQQIRLSGNSSWKWLQNCYLSSSPEHQDVTTALALTELFLRDCGGACRVHGGGFAGTIAVFIPKENSQDYMDYMNHNLGENSCYLMYLRKHGAC
nr:galactokinase [Clostridiales bacterium]